MHMRSFSNLSGHALVVIEDRSASRMKSGKMQGPDAKGERDYEWASCARANWVNISVVLAQNLHRAEAGW